MTCLDETTVLRLVSGAVPANALPEIEAHLDQCATCRRLVSWAKASSEVHDVSTPTLRGDSGEGAAFTSTRELPPGAKVGRYVILGKLGAGGMGVVYLAYDPELERRIALKLIRAEGHGEQAVAELKQRLLREARAMARASHSDVIAVHDAGEVGEHVFVAMEYIEGTTLSGWLAERPREPREVLRIFLRVGRALSAAHAVGLVHRDFKPDNVLVGTDGRVRVTDFGLARLSEEAEPAGLAKPQAPGDAAEPASPAELMRSPASALTRPGAIVGSPAYMAPEQMDGGRAEPAADLFSFSVALFEALAGERPFAGGTLYELRAAIHAGKIREEPAAKIPAWIRRPLVRGLAAAPEKRWPSMAALVAELERDPQRKLRRAALGAAALLCAGGAAFGLFALRSERRQLCSGAEAQLAPVWSDARRGQLRAAFTATGLPFAADAAARVEALLDGYSGAWAAMHREACEATRLRGVQSEELLDRRMWCLGERLREEAALVELLATADKKSVARAAEAAGALTPLSGCADAPALRSKNPEPADPAVRAQLAAVRAQLTRVKALGDLGRYGEAGELALKAAAAARVAGHGPLLAEALERLGHVQNRNVSIAPAEASLREAAALALATGRDDVLAKALLRLVEVLGARRAFPEAYGLAPLADAAASRAEIPALHAGVETELAIVLRREGRIDQALAKARHALELQEQAGAPDDRLVRSLDVLANTLSELGRWKEALPLYERALLLVEKESGPCHPRIAQELTNMSEALFNLGRAKEAADKLRLARAIYVGVHGPDHALIGVIDSNLSGVLTKAGDLKEAEATARSALAIGEKTNARPASIYSALQNLGEILVLEGRAGEAVPLLERSLKLREEKANKAAIGSARLALADALWKTGTDKPRARTLVKKARAELSESKSPELASADKWLAAH